MRLCVPVCGPPGASVPRYYNHIVIVRMRPVARHEWGEGGAAHSPDATPPIRPGEGGGCKASDYVRQIDAWSSAKRHIKCADSITLGAPILQKRHIRCADPREVCL